MVDIDRTMIRTVKKLRAALPFSPRLRNSGMIFATACGSMMFEGMICGSERLARVAKPNKMSCIPAIIPISVVDRRLAIMMK